MIGAGANVTALYEFTPVGGKTLIDPLRYQAGGRRRQPRPTNEIAFLKIRYKPPGAKDSILIERPITNADVRGRSRDGAGINALRHGRRGVRPDAARRSLPGQELTAGSQMLALANARRAMTRSAGAREFVQLVRAAKTPKHPQNRSRLRSRAGARRAPRAARRSEARERNHLRFCRCRAAPRRTAVQDWTQRGEEIGFHRFARITVVALMD